MRTLCCVLCSVLVHATAFAQDQTIAAADKAMGASNLHSIKFSGSGAMFGFQQAPVPGGPWPRFELNSYNIAINYDASAMRHEESRSQGEHPPRGGSGQPMAGSQRTLQFVSGNYAWGENASGAALPNAGAAGDRQFELWSTPHGLIKSALKAGVAAKGKKFKLTLDDQELTVTLNAQNLVETAVYMVNHPQLGDMAIETTYSGYQDFGGIKFPMHIVEVTGGFPTLDVTINKVEPNVEVSLDVPDNVRKAPTTAATPAAGPVAEKMADGVWYLTIGNPRSVVVEFNDYVVVVEGPNNDGQSYATTDWVRKNVSNKPIRYLVNTHHHFDHSGGLRGYVAQGVTIVTHEVNKPYYQKIWTRPHTIKPDSLTTSPRTAVFETLSDKKVIANGTRTLELHHIKGHGHAPGYIMAYLPSEKILIYADSYNPPAGSDPRDKSRTNEFLQGLYDNIQRLQLQPVTLAPLHGRVVPYDNLKKALGVIPVN